MIILGDKRTEVYYFGENSKINISSDGLSIYVDMNLKSYKAATYSNREKCRRAFGHLISALKREEDFYEILTDSDPILNTQMRGSESLKTHNYAKGKTK